MPLTERMPALSRLAAVGVVVALSFGVALTTFGLIDLDGARAPISRHASLVVGLLVLILVVVAVASRRYRLRAMPVGVALGALVALITGKFAALLVVLWFGVAAVALGRLLLGRFGRGAGDLDCMLVGATVYGTIVGLLAHLPVNYVGVYAGLLLVPVLLRWRDSRDLFERAGSWLRAPRQDGLVEQLVPAAIAAFAVVLFLVALMPERGHDALVKHLMVPERLAWQHYWVFDVDTYVWTVMPMLGDWVYSIGFMLGGEVAARLVNLGCVLLLARQVFDLAIWAGARREGALWAVLVLLSTPLTLAESSSLFIESVWSCLVVGGAFALLRLLTGTHEGAGGRLVIGGVLLGGALAAKAVTFMVLPVLALLLVLGVRRWLRVAILPAMAVGTLLFAVIGGFAYAQAWWLTGNPVFPFFNGTFRSPHYPPHDFTAPAIFDKGTTWDVLYRITFESGRFLEAHPGAAGFQWLMLVLPALVLFALVQHRRGLVLLSTAAAVVWLTFAQTAYLRYVFPSFALASAAVGVLIAGAAPRRGAVVSGIRVVAVAVVTLNLLFFSSAGHTHQLSFRVLSSDAARQAWLTEQQPVRAAVALVNELNRAGSPVAFFCRAMATGLHADALFPNWYNHRFQAAVNRASTPEQLGALLGASQVRYVLLEDGWSDAASRARARAVAREIRRVGDVAVLELDERFRFATELLLQNDLRVVDPIARQPWLVDPGVSVSPGSGAVVTDRAGIAQRVNVVGGREYRLTATILQHQDPASARVRVLWLDARDRAIGQAAQAFACAAQAEVHSMDAIAPRGAVAAVLFASGSTGTPVVVQNLSFRN